MRLITVSGAAGKLGKSEGTIRTWADSGRLRVFARLADGTRLFAESDVMALRKTGLAMDRHVGGTNREVRR
jgi:hypothetical protein